MKLIYAWGHQEGGQEGSGRSFPLTSHHITFKSHEPHLIINFTLVQTSLYMALHICKSVVK